MTGVIQVRQNSTVKLYAALKFPLVIMKYAHIPLHVDLKIYLGKKTPDRTNEQEIDLEVIILLSVIVRSQFFKLHTFLNAHK